MTHSMFRLCMILLGALALCLPIKADFQEGFIVTQKGDTLYGKIDMGNPQSMAHRCRFMSGETGKVTRFKPNQLKGFATSNLSRRFVSDTVPYYFKDRILFLEVLQSGRINLYYTYDLVLNNLFYIRKQDSVLTDLMYNWSANKRIGLKADCLESLKKNMMDAPELLLEIGSIKTMTPTVMYELVGKYNRRFEKTTKLTALPEPPPVAKYQKRLGWSVSPGLVCTDLLYMDDIYIDVYSGISITKCPTLTRNGLYFSAGVYKPTFSITTKYGDVSTLPPLYRIDYDYVTLVPVRLAYRFSKNKLQPVVGMVLQSFLNNVDHKFILGPSLGLTFTPIKWVSLSCSLEYNLTEYRMHTVDFVASSALNMTTEISFNF